MVRSRRKDPDQEAIVQIKDNINHRMSKLISLLKEVKKGMNGGPAPGIGISEKINLTQPMPDVVSSSGEAALQELSALIQGIRQVDNMQDSYSAKRDERIAERSKSIQSLQQQAFIKSELEKSASSRVSRLWSHILAPFSSEEGKWERLSLLRSLGRINYNLKEVEDRVLSGDPAILEALYTAKHLYRDAKATFFDEFRRQLNEIKSPLEKKVHEIEKGKNESSKEEKGTTEEFVAPTPKPIDNNKKEKNRSLKNSPVKVPEIIPSEKTKVVEPKKTEKKILEPSIKEQIIHDLEIPIPRKKLVEKVPSVIPSEKGIQKPEEILPSVKEPEKEKNPPEEFVDPDELRKALRVFIWTKSHELYQISQIEIQKYLDISDLWFDRLQSIWNEINQSFSVIKNKPKGDRNWVISFLTFIKAIGDFNANIYVLQSEIKAKELKPDFTFGSSINEENLQNQAKHFVQTNVDELQKYLPQPLVTQASNRITRWLKQMKTHLSGDRDKNLRLLTARYARKSREDLQDMMNLLEKKNINFEYLIKSSKSFFDSIINLYDKLAALADSYNSKMRIEKADKKYHKERMRYDLIPSTDIYALKNIKDDLSRDKSIIYEIQELENKITEWDKSQKGKSE